MSIETIIYNGWQGPVRVALIGVLAYAALVVLLRASGKRTLSKMNAFDSIVTIALGSNLASALLTRDVVFVQAVTAFAVLIGLQLVVTWLSVRSKVVSGIVKSEPALLLYRGQLLNDALKRERVTEVEVLAAIREHGGHSVEQTYAVVIETTGTLSVVADRAADPPDASSSSALSRVANMPPQPCAAPAAPPVDARRGGDGDPS